MIIHNKLDCGQVWRELSYGVLHILWQLTSVFSSSVGFPDLLGDGPAGNLLLRLSLSFFLSLCLGLSMHNVWLWLSAHIPNCWQRKPLWWWLDTLNIRVYQNVIKNYFMKSADKYMQLEKSSSMNFLRHRKTNMVYWHLLIYINF